MKFTEGMWRVKEGVTLDWMSHVERLSVKDDSVDLLLTQLQRSRGDTLNKATISATVRSPLEGVTAVNFTHWDGEEDAGPHFPLSESPPKVDIEHTPGQKVDYTTGPLNLNINAAPNSLAFTYADKDMSRKLTGHSFRSIAYVQSSNAPRYKPEDALYAERTNYILLELDLSVHEKVYGLGERFGPFNKVGQSVEIWNEDGGTSSELTYKNIPFYLSSRGYGVFINNPGRIHLEIQSERTTRVNIAVEGESLEYMLISGSTPRDILTRYTALTGRPVLPPSWSYGLWLTTSFTTSYSESTVTSFLDGFQSRDIPLSVFHFDCFWMRSFQWCDFSFDPASFPHPTTYLSNLKSRGIKLCVWINPYIAQASPLFAEGKKNGYFIMRSDTPRPTVWQWDNWQAGMAIVDFTNPAASNWYSSHLKKLMDMGIDAFKTDFGERIPFDPKKIKYHDGSDPMRMHNFYSYLYNKNVFDGMREHGTPPCLFARSATAGSQQFPVHWGGDCESTFEAMAETLRGGLSLGLSGFSFWAHDIGGFEGLPDPALYKRWVQFGLLSSHSRLHGSSSYRVPWIFEDKFPGEDAKCSAVLREAVKRKLTLMPYILRLGLEAKEQGWPVMRALLFEFGTTDENAWNVDAQFMLGDNLLVAPVFDASGWVKFYVPRTTHSQTPKAHWRSWFDWNKTYEEGRWYEETHGFDTLPVLVKPGAVVPVNGKMTGFEGDVWDGLELLVNGPVEEEGVEVRVVETADAGRAAGRVRVSAEGQVTGGGGGGGGGKGEGVVVKMMDKR